MLVDIIKCNLKFLHRIEALPEQFLSKNALYENKFSYQNKKSSWSSNFHFILDKLQLQHLIHDRNSVSIASNKFCEIYKNTWGNALADNAEHKLVNSEHMLFLKQDFVEKIFFLLPAILMKMKFTLYLIVHQTIH